MLSPMFLVIAILSGIFIQASSPVAPAVVEGTVTNRVTGAPVKQAHVMWMKAVPEPGRTPAIIKADTDASGHFAVQLEPGAYELWVERLGFSRQAYGAQTAEGTGKAITLAPGQRLQELTISLSPYGVIAGRVLDEDGDPLQGASIQVLRFNYTTGRRELIPIHGTSTNDRGEYRAYGLPPGRYFLLAARNDGAYASLYYPGVLDMASASEVSLPEGGEIDGADFHLQNIPVFTLRGRLLSPAPDFAGSQLQVVLAHREGDFASSTGRISAKVDAATGRFEISNVAPGSYLLVASQLYGKMPLSGRISVEVRDTAPPDDIAVPLVAAFAVNGKLDLEGGGEPPPMNVGLRPAEALALGQQPVAVAGPGGRIHLSGVTPGVWELASDPLPEKFCLKSATFNDVDLLRERLHLSGSPRGELHLVLSDQCPRIAGAVIGADGQPHGATVILAPAEPERRNSSQAFRVATAHDRGTFVFKGVRPGSYKLFALEEVAPFAWLNPELLQTIESKGELVSVSQGDQATRQLLLIPPDALLPGH